MRPNPPPQKRIIPQEACLNKSSELWNEILKISVEDLHPDDMKDIRYHLNAIQNILYTQLYIKKHGKL